MRALQLLLPPPLLQPRPLTLLRSTSCPGRCSPGTAAAVAPAAEARQLLSPELLLLRSKTQRAAAAQGLGGPQTAQGLPARQQGRPSGWCAAACSCLVASLPAGVQPRETACPPPPPLQPPLPLQQQQLQLLQPQGLLQLLPLQTPGC
jgi:hypothetical protein